MFHPTMIKPTYIVISDRLQQQVSEFGLSLFPSSLDFAMIELSLHLHTVSSDLRFSFLQARFRPRFAIKSRLSFRFLLNSFGSRQHLSRSAVFVEQLLSEA